MEDLARHLALRTPILWIATDEAVTTVDAIAQLSDRPVYRMDARVGLLTHDDKRQRWVKMLLPHPEDPSTLSPTKDLELAIDHAFASRGVMIFPNAHNMLEPPSPLLGLLMHAVERWQRAVAADDAEELPPTFVLLSYDQKIPAELRRSTVLTNVTLPDAKKLKALLDDVVKASGQHVSNDVSSQLQRSGLGMSTFEFVHALSQSLNRFARFDPTFVNELKLKRLAQTGILEMRSPTLTIDDIGGMDNAKKLFSNSTWIWNNVEEAKKLHIAPLRRILLVGVPGSGKSALCEAAATSLQLDLAKFGVSAMMNKYVGQSESNMRDAFAQIKAMAPLCLWIDELGRDLSGGQSSGSVDGGTTDRVHGEFLQGLQELPSTVFLVAAANRIEDLPPEMLRADRFDKILFVGFPTEQEREEIWRIHLGEAAKSYNISVLAKHTKRFTGAEIKSLIAHARFWISAKEKRPPTTQELVESARTLKGRVWNNHRQSIVSMYERALNEWDWASSSQEDEARADFARNHAQQSSAPKATSPVPSSASEHVAPSLSSLF